MSSASAWANSTGSPFWTTYGGTWLAHDTRLSQAWLRLRLQHGPVHAEVELPLDQLRPGRRERLRGDHQRPVRRTARASAGPSPRSFESSAHATMNSSTPCTEKKSSCVRVHERAGTAAPGGRPRGGRSPRGPRSSCRGPGSAPPPRAALGSSGNSSSRIAGSLAGGLAVSSSPPNPPPSSSSSSSRSTTSSGPPAARRRGRSRVRGAHRPPPSRARTAPP